MSNINANLRRAWGELGQDDCLDLKPLFKVYTARD